MDQLTTEIALACQAGQAQQVIELLELMEHSPKEDDDTVLWLVEA